MKLKIKTAALLLSAIAILTACNNKNEDNSELPAIETQATETQAIQAKTATIKHTLADDYSLTAENFPLIDGSTSTIPLVGGLKAMLFGVPQLEAENTVSHTKTHTAFQNLLDGKCDVIFTVPLSKEQEQEARERGIEIEMLPVAVEGFVFVVNKENPVTALSQEQLRGIYSGEITNWGELGGNDAPIIAYQRNLDSGSQNHMLEFMGVVPLSDPILELVRTGMDSLMDSIAVYDNAVDSIGYSVYSYAGQMYSEVMNVKFIEVDGVPISLDTLADKSYPLLSVTYMMYRKDTPADSPVLRLAEFVQSEEGTAAIRGAGYVPYN
ncbi:MAG: substrate-binding domain-containing protein [Oscillospiraceae bacterium]|nr:substrate-binding domain-containing protein [Oscillospiraceae bacterium]